MYVNKSRCQFNKLFILLIAFSSVFEGFAQQHYSGKVVGSNQKPIPYAHIHVDNTGLGTITNTNGEFKLYIPSKIATYVIEISCIGYQSKKITLTKPYVTITLKEDIKLLSEVVVTPRDYARELIEKAIANIPLNYPNQTELHTGFFRETTNWDEPKEFEPMYIAEAVIESIKKPYIQKSINGTVRVVEGRNYQSNYLDTLNTRVYAGPHISHSFDIIARREAFLSHPKAYTFEIEDTTRINNKDVFKVSFNKKNDGISGYVYVLDSSFAVIKGEFKKNKFNSFDIRDWGRRFRNYTVSYSYNGDSKWRLKHITYSTAFNRQKGILNLFGEYVTTNTRVDTTSISIPYQERIQFNDIFLYNTGEYNLDFWGNYNTTLDPKIEPYFDKKPQKPKDINEQSKNSRLINILAKLSLTYDMTYFPFQLQNYSVSYANSEFSLNQNGLEENVSSMGISTGLHYHIKSNYTIGLNSVTTFSKNKVESYDVEFLKEINLNPNRRPIFLSSGLQFGHQKMNYLLGRFKSENTFTVNDKEFDSGETDLYLQQKGWRLQPVVSLGIEKSSRLSFFLTAGYNIVLSKKIGLYFDEKDQFFLKQKSVFLKNNQEGLLITHNGELLKNTFSLSFGLRLRFK